MNDYVLRAFPEALAFVQHNIFGIPLNKVCKRNNTFELIKKATTGLLFAVAKAGIPACRRQGTNTVG